jgi:hypothetical protein
MNMDIYEGIDTIVAAFIRFAEGGTIGRIAEDGPALALRFWETNAAVATGVSVAQIAAAFVSALFVFVIAVAVMKKQALNAPLAAESAGVLADVPAEAPREGGALRERWNEILRHLEAPQEAEWKVAVMEADKLVDTALSRAGFPGDSFGDRLTNIQPGTLLALDGLWWAHKIRNRLAHEMDYFLRYTEARQAVSYYEQALAELQLI